MQQILVGNFLKTQSVNKIVPQAQQELKPQPNSPGGVGTLKSRQGERIQRRLPNSLSATNLTNLQRPQSMTP